MSSVDAEDLIAHLSGGLSPADRTAFRKAAEAALTTPNCSGEGATYRVIAKLWRSYFRPPTDTGGASWYAKRERPASKLLAEEEAPDRQARHRTRNLRVVG